MIRSSVLSVINQIICDFEDAGMQKEASLVHDIYLKCAKAKSKSKKKIIQKLSIHFEIWYLL